MKNKKSILTLITTLFLSASILSACGKTELTKDNFYDYFDVSLHFDNIIKDDTKDIGTGIFASYWTEGDLVINISNIKKVKCSNVKVTAKITVNCKSDWYQQKPTDEISITIPYDGKVETIVPYKVKSDVSPLLEPTIDDITIEIISISGTV